MPLYEKSWWKRMFKEDTRKKVDPMKNIQATTEFLEDFSYDQEFLVKELGKLEELEKERQVGSKGIMRANLEAQARVLDKILQRYEFFQNDAIINGMRVKSLAEHLIKEARKEGLKDLVNKKKKDIKWRFEW